MGIGIPGSGKTSALKPFAEKNGYMYVCADDIRAELSGDASTQLPPKKVWGIAYARIADALARGTSVVVDGTFAKPADRDSLLTFARKHGATRVEAIFVDTPLEVALKRNALRDRIVPTGVTQNMHDLLRTRPPDITDGFDAVFDLDEHHAIKHGVTLHEGEPLYKEFKRVR